MKMAVIGGNSRDIGKTSVVADLIRALPHRNWLAIKLSHFEDESAGNDSQQHDYAPHHHSPDESGFAIREESDRSGTTDTSRFLQAGARRALWVIARRGMLESSIPALWKQIASEENVIVESNSILRYVQPNIYLSLLDPSITDFKASAREYLTRADAFLTLAPFPETPAWEGISLDVLRAKPIFAVTPQCYVTPEIASFVEERLQRGEAARYLSS